MSHADTIFTMLNRPPTAPPFKPCVEQSARVKLLALDLETLSQAVRALLTELHPRLNGELPDAWEEAAALVGWQDKANIRAARFSPDVDAPSNGQHAAVPPC